MRPCKYKHLCLLVAITTGFFCTATMVIAASPNPPESMRNVLTSHPETVDEAVAFQGKAAPVFAAAYLVPDRYLVLEIPPVEGKDFSKGYGINNSSKVTGWSYNRDPVDQTTVDLTAFFWDFSTGITALPTLDGASGAWGINDTGTAIGFSTNAAGHKRAVSWLLDEGTITDLGTLINPDTQQAGDAGYAYWGINNAHTIVGHAEIPNAAGDTNYFHGFIYDTVSGMRDLGTLSSSTEYMGGYSIAYDINAANTVVGIAHNNSWALRPFIWTEAAGMTELPIDAQYAAGEWYAGSINDSGLIGGHVIDGDALYPYYWPTRDDAPVAVVMPDSHPHGEIYGINQHGQMVGSMYSATDEDLAFIFDPDNGLTNLNDLIQPGSNWELQAAVAINDLGQITGHGTLNGAERAFLLTPNADADGDADIDGSDMARLIQELGQTACGDSCACDFNADEAVNGVDVALLAMVMGTN